MGIFLEQHEDYSGSPGWPWVDSAQLRTNLDNYTGNCIPKTLTWLKMNKEKILRMRNFPKKLLPGGIFWEYPRKSELGVFIQHLHNGTRRGAGAEEIPGGSTSLLTSDAL